MRIDKWDIIIIVLALLFIAEVVWSVWFYG